MIPLEVVMRRIATGSYLKRNAVPEGTRFEPTVVEFFFKDDANHDPLVDDAWIVEHRVATAEEIETPARALAGRSSPRWRRPGPAQDVQLVDLKIEFGRDVDGELLVADVIDNDSWRIWPGGRKEAMLDKQVYRDTAEVTDEALRGVLAKYAQVAELTDAFVADPHRADTSPVRGSGACDADNGRRGRRAGSSASGARGRCRAHDADGADGAAAPGAGERGRRGAGARRGFALRSAWDGSIRSSGRMRSMR